MKIPLTIAASGLLMLACGSSDPPTATTSPATPATALTITVDQGGGGEVSQYTLTCEPPGGDHPDPDAACAALAEASAAQPNPLDPVPADVACTEIYGGDQTAVIEGTLGGKAVRAELSRVNGCEIARWDALVPVLVEPGGVRAE